MKNSFSNHAKRWSFIEFKLIVPHINSNPAFFLPQSENISMTNGRLIAPFCMSGYLYDEDEQIVIDLAEEMAVEQVSADLQKASIKAFGVSHAPDLDKLQEYYQAREKDLQTW
jgi:hypothetical protein